jgi:hypothetical protein
MKRFVTVLATVALVIGWTARPAAGQFFVADALNEHDYEDFFEEFYDRVATELNSLFAMPERVGLTSAICGEPNAFFDTEGRQIIFCAELLELMASSIDPSIDEPMQELMALAQVSFILTHEVGHALIRVLDLPALGQEEDVADQLGALLMTNEPILAMWAADFWRTMSGLGGQQLTPTAFADTHDLNQQRYYNLMCWAYGADPLVRSYIALQSELPPERAQSCQDEYSRMISSWERLLTPHLKDPAMFAEFNPKRNASGFWRFMEAMEDAAGEVRCTASGTMGLWQTAEQFTGQLNQEGLCVLYGVTYDNAAEFVIEAGTVIDSTLTFTVESCTYTGRIQTPDATRIDGTITCTLQEDDAVLELTGEWSAVR